MPYDNIKDLPESIQNALPVHAQEIYLASFNNAYEEYKDKSKLRSVSDDREKVAHKVAWAAVKNKYKKTTDGKWKEKSY